MMGVGKSTIGRLLAKKLAVRFIDIDKIIEKQEKKSIKKIFEVFGETYFRKLEEKTTLKLIQNKESVIALGGGSFENDRTRLIVLKYNFSIWLKCNLKTLSYRCDNRNTRPLLNGKNIRSEIGKLDKIRKKNYMKSSLTVDVSKKSKALIVHEIISKLNNE